MKKVDAAKPRPRNLASRTTIYTGGSRAGWCGADCSWVGRNFVSAWESVGSGSIGEDDVTLILR